VHLIKTDVSRKLSPPSSGRLFRNMHRMLVSANIVPRSPILETQMMKVIHSSETSVLTRATRHYIPAGSFLPSQDVITNLDSDLDYKFFEERHFTGCYAMWLL
jgi:hypothetical protein